jgi:hypothetical protein
VSLLCMVHTVTPRKLQSTRGPISPLLQPVCFGGTFRATMVGLSVTAVVLATCFTATATAASPSPAAPPPLQCSRLIAGILGSSNIASVVVTDEAECCGKVLDSAPSTHSMDAYNSTDIACCGCGMRGQRRASCSMLCNVSYTCWPPCCVVSAVIMPRTRRSGHSCSLHGCFLTFFQIPSKERRSHTR